MIGVVDYGAGNLRSVMNALEFLDVECRLVTGPEDMEGIDKLLLPGVGEFRSAMTAIKEKGLEGPIREWLEADRPFLGICLGMQMLFETSEEAEGVKGFGVLRGTVPRFSSERVPQIGWNQVRGKGGTKLLDGIEDGSYFYFLHSFYARPEDDVVTAGVTEYGMEYTSMVERGNVRGVQFHPEKSGDAGLKLLRNWVERC